MTIELKMPALSPTMEEGTLAKWLVKEGDTVTAGDVLAEIETDKATMEFESIDEGTVGKILVPEGSENVKVGTVIAVLAGEGEDIAHPQPLPQAGGEREDANTPLPPAGGVGGGPVVPPPYGTGPPLAPPASGRGTDHSTRSRSSTSNTSRLSPGLMSLVSASTTPHSRPVRTSSTSSLNRRSEAMVVAETMTSSRVRRA